MQTHKSEKIHPSQPQFNALGDPFFAAPVTISKGITVYATFDENKNPLKFVILASLFHQAVAMHGAAHGYLNRNLAKFKDMQTLGPYKKQKVFYERIDAYFDLLTKVIKNLSEFKNAQLMLNCVVESNIGCPETAELNAPIFEKFFKELDPLLQNRKFNSVCKVFAVTGMNGTEHDVGSKFSNLKGKWDILKKRFPSLNIEFLNKYVYTTAQQKCLSSSPWSDPAYKAVYSNFVKNDKEEGEELCKEFPALKEIFKDVDNEIAAFEGPEGPPPHVMAEMHQEMLTIFQKMQLRQKTPPSSGPNTMITTSLPHLASNPNSLHNTPNKEQPKEESAFKKHLSIGSANVSKQSTPGQNDNISIYQDDGNKKNQNVEIASTKENDPFIKSVINLSKGNFTFGIERKHIARRLDGFFNEDVEANHDSKDDERGFPHKKHGILFGLPTKLITEEADKKFVAFNLDELDELEEHKENLNNSAFHEKEVNILSDSFDKYLRIGKKGHTDFFKPEPDRNKLVGYNRTTKSEPNVLQPPIGPRLFSENWKKDVNKKDFPLSQNEDCNEMSESNPGIPKTKTQPK